VKGMDEILAWLAAKEKRLADLTDAEANQLEAEFDALLKALEKPWPNSARFH
jgi:hypothetical protein